MQKLHLKPAGIMILFLALAVTVSIVALAQLGVIDLSQQLTDILMFLAAAFVLAEAGLLAMIKGKKLSNDYFRLFGVIVATVSIVALALSWIGITYPFIENMKGFIDAILVIYVLIEAFRK